MAQTDDRVNLIGAAIMGQAEQEARKIIDGANDIRAREIAKAKSEIIGKMFEKLQEKTGGIRMNSVKTIARAEHKARREVIKLRESKTDKIFESVTARLLEYAGTDECKAALLKKAAGLRGAYGGSDALVLVKSGQEAFGEKIAEAVGCAGVNADPLIKIGGFKLKNEKARVLVDETFDERLLEQKSWFLQNCGLKVTV